VYGERDNVSAVLCGPMLDTVVSSVIVNVNNSGDAIKQSSPRLRRRPVYNAACHFHGSF